MWDILLEFLAYLGIRSLKKKKGENAELTPTATVDPNKEQNLSGREIREGAFVCAGCGFKFEKGAVHELGKDWCMDCYKSQVLKVQE